MPTLKNKFCGSKESNFQVVGILVLIFLALFLLWFNNANSNQAASAISGKVCFDGEYRIGDGPWQKITEGEHIPTTEGDVTLRGNFHMFTPDDQYVGLLSEDTLLAFYTNHISLTFCEGEDQTYQMDLENPLFGPSACGVAWTAHLISGKNTEPIEIIVHNPHRFGNETAIDEMISNVAIWSGIDFEHDILDSGRYQRNTGLTLVIVSFVLLGSALYSVLLHIQNNRIIWLLGMTIFSAGIYLAYSAPGVSFWKESITTNTTILGCSMMFYMLFVSIVIAYFLHGTKRVGSITMVVLGSIDAIYFILPVVTDLYFYDTWLPWVLTQSASNMVLLVCLVKDYLSLSTKQRWMYIGMAVILLSFEADALATALGSWEGGLISKYVFCALFVTALFVVLRIIPESINATVKARELELQRRHLEVEKNIVEAELQESRISIMLSQIKPHFIYNVLNTIYHLYRKEPETAQEAVSSFAEYLRCNMLSIEKSGLIPFSEEYQHIQTYLSLEQIRFRDKLDIVYDVDVIDFKVPPLSIEPLVENAVKHGVTKKRGGGVVTISTRKTKDGVQITIADTGIGFDPKHYMEDGKPHVGIRNVRNRLQNMVGGSLTITSSGTGTVAVVTIPQKEVKR